MAERLVQLQRVEAMMDEGAAFAWVVDMDGSVASVTASAGGVLGYGQGEFEAGWFAGRLLSSETRSRWLDLFPRILRQAAGHAGNPSGIWALDMEFIRRDGSAVPMETTVSLMLARDGNPCGLVCQARHRNGGAAPGGPADLSGRRRSEEELARSESHLRLLTQRMLEIQESERARFARDLHDELGQDLVFLKMQARSLAMNLAGVPQLQEKAVEIADMADRLKMTSTRIAASIGPGILDGLGLVRAVEWCAEDFERRTGISCPVDTPIADLDVPQPTAAAAYRILQEALTNAWRHAGASQVEVKLEREGDWVALTVADNGVGINPGLLSGKSTLGLLGMHERARLAGGALNISGGPGRGTRIVASLPLTEGQAGLSPSGVGGRS